MQIPIRAYKQINIIFIKPVLRISRGIKIKKFLNCDLAAAQPLYKIGGD